MAKARASMGEVEWDKLGGEQGAMALRTGSHIHASQENAALLRSAAAAAAFDGARGDAEGGAWVNYFAEQRESADRKTHEQLSDQLALQMENQDFISHGSADAAYYGRRPGNFGAASGIGGGVGGAGGSDIINLDDDYGMITQEHTHYNGNCDMFGQTIDPQDQLMLWNITANSAIAEPVRMGLSDVASSSSSGEFCSAVFHLSQY